MKNLVITLFLFVSSGVNGQSPLLASQYSDGGCSFPAPASNATAILFTYSTPQVHPAYYVSKSFAINCAKVFLGRDPANWTEVNGLCYNLGFTDSVAIQSGYNETKVWIDTALPQVNTTYPFGLFTYSNTVTKTPGVVTAPRENFTATIVWTDGTNVLAVFCVLNQTQDWALYSSNGPAPQWTKDLALNLLTTQYGFDASNAMDFTNCPTPATYPAYVFNALQNLGLPTTQLGVRTALVNAILNPVGAIYIALLASLYKVLGIVVFPFIG